MTPSSQPSSNSLSGQGAATQVNPKAAVPILLIAFVFCLVIDNGFKFLNLPIAQDLGLSVTAVSLQATLAGIIIGIGAVVYAALADIFSIRSLMIIGLVVVAVGSLLGYVGSSVWALVLIGRCVQTCGLAAAETLYVIYVTKHLSAADQKTYLGFSTSAFQLAMLFSTLTSGFVATYISWTAMFLLPLLALLAIPVILRKVPTEARVHGHVDVFGLLLITVFSSCLIIFMQHYRWWWLLLFVVSVGLFAWHVRSHPRALVRPEFFRNSRYVWTLVVVFLVYSTQLGLTFMLPFLLENMHSSELDGSALVVAPGYACGAVVGACSGWIGKRLSSRTTVLAALTCLMGSLVAMALLVTAPVWTLVVMVMFFSGGFALMYAPLLNSAVGSIPPEHSGVAVGFYNLTINISVPLGMAYTASLMTLFGVDTASGAALAGPAGYSCVFLVLAAVVIAGMLVYLFSDRLLRTPTHPAAAH